MRETEELTDLAARLVWWQEPGISLENPERFLAQVMTLGTWREVQMVRGIFGWDAFKAALKNAPPGVYDARSWSYWHGFFDLPEREMPRRSLT